MDRVTESLLNEFSSERDLSDFTEDKRFEHFTAFITIGQHYSSTFDTQDVLVGEATGIDAIATIINGDLITDAESIKEYTGEIDVTFVLVQADRGPGFDASKMGSFGFAAGDFLRNSLRCQEIQK